MKPNRLIVAVFLAAIAAIAPLIVSAGSANEYGKLEGVVKDSETGKPIQNVYVYVDGCPTAAMTNSSGKFFLNDVPTGSCTLKVGKNGYYPFENGVTVEKRRTGTLTIKLQRQPEPIQAVETKNQGST
ncbi:MAG TPA: carboxypeptidase regulatory-like domain-containing protein [bacterium]